MKKLRTNRLKYANFFSALTYWWMNDFFRYGSKNDLKETDMLELLESDVSHKQCSKVERAWMKELDCAKKPSLTNAIFSSFKFRIMLGGIACMLEEFLRLGIALMIAYLVRYFERQDVVPLSHAYGLACGIGLASTLMGIWHHQVFYQNYRVGWHIRVALCGMMYKKTLRLSHHAIKKTTAGTIVNLAANDVLRYDQLVAFMHYCWIGPLQCALATTVLWFEFGAAIIAGMGVLCFMLMVQILCGKFYSKMRSTIAGITDRRVRIMNEVIAGIRVIKMYAWEKPFMILLGKIRRNEVRKILLSSSVKACNMAVFVTQQRFAAFVTLIVYVFTGGDLTAFKAFLLIGVLETLRFPAGSGFLRGVERISESSVANERVQKFLLLDEFTANDSVINIEGGESTDERANVGSSTIVMNKFSATWVEEIDESRTSGNTLTLEDITFRVKQGELVAVVGPVGAGKSSLLSAILGELSPTSGEIVIDGKVAYASQSPWVFSGTIRDNVLFGELFDELRYRSVLSSCGLTKDLEAFQDGDLTLVGERGVTLSGGQKSRLNLARAVYKTDACIYLLDDPLSAVDVPVAQHIYTECITKLLRNKGKVEDFGNYEELTHRQEDFAALVKPLGSGLGTKYTGVSPTESSLESSQSDSLSSVSSCKDTNEENIIPVEREEELQQGSIELKTYTKYFRDGGNFILLSSLLILFVASHILFILNDWWITQWVSQREIAERNDDTPNSTQVPIFPTLSDNTYYAPVYAAIFASFFIAMMLRFNLNMYVCVNSGIKMHTDMLRAIIKAPIRFFDTTPVGRILNRFSKDMGQVDELLPITYLHFLGNCGRIFSVIILVAVMNYFALGIILPAATYFVWLRRYFIRTSRDIKRLEGSCRSPVFSLLSSTLDGLVTIRGFKAGDKFLRKFHETQDLHSAAWFLFLTGSRWFALRLDLMSSVFLGLTALLSVVGASILNINAGIVGLILTQAAACNALFQHGVFQSSEVESHMTSVERIRQYSCIAPEPLREIAENKLPSSWPSMGTIKFANVYFAYFDDGPNILKNLNFVITAGEKVGLVGRTGAGKSSVISALLRLAELRKGEIFIDGLAISSVGLHDLRSAISIIPQDPVLFSGTLRRNLDPFSKHTDDEIWDALNQVQLGGAIISLVNRLDTVVSESGSNFSVGQRQLICLARAILRKNKVILVDEATANVDYETDMKIQETLRERFSDCTVVTIAHRINTILGSDKIIVLNDGMVEEFGSPLDLLQHERGAFRCMVEASGLENSPLLRP